MARYAIIGTGGVGGTYGMHLARTGAPVDFLIRSDVKGDLQLQAPSGTFALRPGRDCGVYRRVEDLPPADIAIVAVKATANDEVAPSLAGVVKPGGAVVLAQNGIDGEPGYAAALEGKAEVVGGLAFLASHRAAPGRFVHLDYGALTLGRYADGYVPAPPNAAMATLADDLGRAGIPVVLTDDLLAARWQKLVWNIPFNGLSVLLDARTDAIMADPAATRLVSDLMAEVVGAAAGDGRALADGLAEGMLAMTRAMKPYAPSMKLDYDHGRPMELAAMYLAPIARAGRAGCDMPRAKMLADALEFLDARNLAGQ